MGEKTNKKSDSIRSKEGGVAGPFEGPRVECVLINGMRYGRGGEGNWTFLGNFCKMSILMFWGVNALPFIINASASQSQKRRTCGTFFRYLQTNAYVNVRSAMCHLHRKMKMHRVFLGKVHECPNSWSVLNFWTLLAAPRNSTPTSWVWGSGIRKDSHERNAFKNIEFIHEI